MVLTSLLNQASPWVLPSSNPAILHSYKQNCT